MQNILRIKQCRSISRGDHAPSFFQLMDCIVHAKCRAVRCMTLFVLRDVPGLQRQNLLQLSGRYREQAYFGQALGEDAPVGFLLENGL